MMGDIFKRATEYTRFDEDDIILEIGSDRYEGSTEYFASLGQEFYTVDILENAKRRLQGVSNINFQIGFGSEWCEHELPKLDKKIGLVYLDNFDYIWDVTNIQPHIKNQKQQYAEMGIIMDNTNCQIEHLRQTMLIYPHLTEQAVVVYDDTYTYNGCWIGKGGPGVTWLLAQGFRVREFNKHVPGVILTR
jgi:hypothetical protein